MTHAEALRQAAKAAQVAQKPLICVSPSRLLIILDQLQDAENDLERRPGWL